MLHDGISTCISLMKNAYECPSFDENIIKRAILLKESRKFTKFFGITPIIKYCDYLEIFNGADPFIEEWLSVARVFHLLKKELILEFDSVERELTYTIKEFYTNMLIMYWLLVNMTIYR